MMRSHITDTCVFTHVRLHHVHRFNFVNYMENIWKLYLQFFGNNVTDIIHQ